MNETKTYKKLLKEPSNNFPKWLIIHHTGGTDADPLADTSNHTAEIVEEWHLKKGWDGIGYHFFIEKSGLVWRGRPEHRNGAHTTSHNNNSLGICLAGNFDLTKPSKNQEKALRELLTEMVAIYKIPVSNIVPHRKFAAKTCYGNLLSDSWARDLLVKQASSFDDFSTLDLLKIAHQRSDFWQSLAKLWS